MKRKASCLVGILILISLLLDSQVLCSAPYYEGKTLRIIVWTAPGGGNDLMARIVAKHLPKHIPGKPTIIVENMPGATGIIAANYLYNMVEPDGLTIEAISRGLPFPQLLKAKSVKYDLRKFAWIGSTAVEATVLVIRTDLPYKTFDDLRKTKRRIYIAGTGPSEAANQFAIFLKELLGLDMSFVTYQGGSDCNLAMERKEVDGRSALYSSLTQLIERGVVRPVIRGRASVPEIENLPVDEDVTADKTGKTIMAMRSVVDLIGRPYVASPRTPDKVVNILRDAFDKMAKDREVQADAKRFMMGVKYVPAVECMKVLDYLFNQPSDILKEFNKYVQL